MWIVEGVFFGKVQLGWTPTRSNCPCGWGYVQFAERFPSREAAEAKAKELGGFCPKCRGELVGVTSTVALEKAGIKFRRPRAIVERGGRS